MSVINTLLALTMIMVAGRADANCFSAGPQPVAQSRMMENCTDMEANLVGPEESAPPHHSDERQNGMCHLGCSVLFKAATAQNYHIVLHSLKYLLELEPLSVGINAIPQTPPPRFG
jgi:hypothetical protein